MKTVPKKRQRQGAVGGLKRPRVIPGFLAGLAVVVGAQAGQYNNDFTSDTLVGAAIYGAPPDSGVIEEGVLKLTKNVNSQQGGFVIEDLDGGAKIYGFTATFDLLMGGGNGADGFSFNFGPDIPDASMGEEGAGTGLTIAFDSYDNGGGEAPAIDVKKGGAVIASVKGFARTRLVPNKFVRVRVNVDPDGTLDLSYGDDWVVYTNLVGAFNPSAGRFAMGARTGGLNENQFVDNLSILTTLTPPSGPTVASASPQGSGARPDAVVTVTVKDQGAVTLNASSVKLNFDGTDVTPAVSKSGDTTTITYDPPGFLASNSAHTVALSFTDSAGTPTSFSFTFTVTTYSVTIAPSAKVTPDASKRGFIWRVFANSANQANSNARTEAALAGQLVDSTGSPLPNLAEPSAQGAALAPAAAPSPANAPITFEIEGVINLSQEGADNAGAFTPDEVMPGIPATDGSTDGIAAEVITYIELPAGVTVMGVASDDGFRTTTGAPWDAFGSVVLGEFDGGRGVADTLFTFVVEEAGVYPFRTIWEEGGGGANIEWFTLKADGVTKVLVNDTANGGLKAYRATTTPIPAHVKSIRPGPAPRQLNGVSSDIKVVLEDGATSAVDDNSIVLKIDGQPVTVTKAREGKTVNVTYTPAGLQIPSEAHTAELTFKDSAGKSRTDQWPFRNLKTLILPAPKILETFDTYPEDTQPTGWVAVNFTAHNDDVRDITSQTSESYENWVLVDVSNIASIDGGRPFNITPGQKYNGMEIKNGDPVGGTFPEWLMSGNVLYAESDSRNNTDSRGGPNNGQTQFITTKPYDLSAYKGVVITFSSIYEQNQDSLGAVEYSVDGGASWLPVVYFLDSRDIKLKADGTVDAIRTFNDANADTSSWVDNGVAKGDKYGDGLAAPITDALGPYVVPRINDDQVEGKRIEVFRLSQAAGKNDVRLRFAQLGTDSWYFAIDNLAFYDIEEPKPVQPSLAVSRSAGEVTVSWDAAVSGFTLESTDSLSAPNWQPVSGVSNNSYKTTPASGSRFYRLKK